MHEHTASHPMTTMPCSHCSQKRNLSALVRSRAALTAYMCIALLLVFVVAIASLRDHHVVTNKHISTHTAVIFEGLPGGCVAQSSASSSSSLVPSPAGDNSGDDGHLMQWTLLSPADLEAFGCGGGRKSPLDSLQLETQTGGDNGTSGATIIMCTKSGYVPRDDRFPHWHREGARFGTYSRYVLLPPPNGTTTTTSDGHSPQPLPPPPQLLTTPLELLLAISGMGPKGRSGWERKNTRLSPPLPSLLRTPEAAAFFARAVVRRTQKGLTLISGRTSVEGGEIFEVKISAEPNRGGCLPVRLVTASLAITVVVDAMCGSVSQTREETTFWGEAGDDRVICID